MDVEEADGVVDEVLEIERTMQMDMEQIKAHEGVIISQDIQMKIDETDQGEQEMETTITELEDPGQSPEEQSSDTEEALPIDGQDVTFIVQLNDEGAIMLDKTGVVPTDAEPHVYFPITLPATKVKSTDNPLVGATHFPVQRSRKTKPQAILYNDDIDQIYEMLPDGSLNTITTPGGEQGEQVPSDNTEMAETMEISDFASHILPKDFELMERVLANATEALDIPHSSAKATTSREHRLEPAEAHFDHSYCAYQIEIDPTRYNGKSKITILPPGDVLSGTQPIEYDLPKPSYDDGDTEIRPIMRIQPDGNFVPLHPYLWEMNQRVHEEDPTEGVETVEYVQNLETTDKNIKDEVAKHPIVTTHEGLSLSEVNARSRRSQRQQDRIERQEAERILAENQQMLQREKELYGGKGSISPSGTSPVCPQIDTPQAVAIAAPVVTPVSASTSQKDLDTSAEETPSSRRPYPKRQNRKLPAHLADPNYVNLDEAERKTHEEVQERDAKGKGENKSDSDSNKEISEDDPNKLWCICQKPHNNRFMICCDTCEDWFHGKCVGVTKAVGAKIDKWVCPNCRKKKKNEKETLQTPIAKISRKVKAVTTGRKLKVENPEKGPVPPARKLSLPLNINKEKDEQSKPVPEKVRQRRVTENSQTSQPNTAESTTPATTGKCIICKTKQARVGSVFCTDECVVKHSHEAGGTGTPATTTTATASKLKRSNSKVADKEEMENFLTFHVISAGAPKSTVVVPPKPKETIVSSPTKSLPPPKPAPTSSADPVVVANQSVIVKSSAPAASDKALTSKRGSESQASAEPKRTKFVEAERLRTKRGSRSSLGSNRKTSESSSKPAPEESRPARKRNVSGGDKSKQKDSDKPKKDIQEQKKETEAEILVHRQAFRTKIAEAFESRLKELTDTERADIPSTNTPEAISEEIELELFNTFSFNGKYKSKFRSILFNLKDSKNNLYKTISMNELKAKELVKLESHQLASDELAQWRLNESKKELELIKRSEIDKLQELKNQERIDAELGFENITDTPADDEVRFHAPTNIDVKPELSAIGDHVHRSSTRSSPRHKSHSQASKTGDKSDSPTPQVKNSDDITSSKKKESDNSSSSNHRRTRSSGNKDPKKDDKSSKGENGKEDRKSQHKSTSSDHRKSTSGEKHSTSHSSSSVQESKHKGSSSEKEKDSGRSLRSREHGLRSSSSSASNRKRQHSESDYKDSGRSSDKSKVKKSNLSGSQTVVGDVGAESLKKDSATLDHSHSISVTTTKADTRRSKGLLPVGKTGHKAGFETEHGPPFVTGVSFDSSSLDQELPSSTIKTPDFTTEESNSVPIVDHVEVQQPILSSKFTMPELGSFNATLYNVSHYDINGTFFPSTPVPIVGRINPSLVWDYINKSKKSKEVIILRLAPATPADTEGYMTFFSYFSSRTRFGVLGGIDAPLKDVYLVPLDKNSPVNKALLPMHGPGLPSKRAHCLLAVVTRSFCDTLGSRRKLSISKELSPKVKMGISHIKAGQVSSLNLLAGRERRGSPGAGTSSASKKCHDDKISPREDHTAGTIDMNDDDLPYTPWEEEESTSPKGGPDPGSIAVGTDSSDPKIMEQIKDLEAQIQQEQAAIENISMSLIASSKVQAVPLLIPGLDGEFEADVATTAPLQFLRQLPVKESKPTVQKPISESPLQETGVKDVIIIEDESQEACEDDSAPYSPSQLDLEEEVGS